MHKHGCDIVAVGKRRDGGTRYWCLSHRSDATAKYGVPAEFCVAAHDEPIPEAEILDLSVDSDPRTVAFEVALPPVFDTTAKAPHFVIRVFQHATNGGQSPQARVARRLRIRVNGEPEEAFEIDALDFLNHMVSTTFGFETKVVACTNCGFVHLDRDWFAVHRHKRHLCHGCGKHFADSEAGIGNPVARLFSIFKGAPIRPAFRSQESLKIRQTDFPGGVRIGVMPPTLAWEQELVRPYSLHVTAFRSHDALPYVDGHYGEVEVDGISIDFDQIGTYAAQMVMPHIRDRVVALDCPSCGSPHFDVGECAYTPHAEHECSRCGHIFFAPTRLKLTIGNPFVEVRRQIAARSCASLREHVLNLRPETI